MRLRSALKELNNDELVYIGSKSAFFFVGHPQEFLEQADEISNAWHMKFLHFEQNAQKALENHQFIKPRNGKNAIRKIYNVSTRKNEDIVVSYKDLMKEWERRYKSLQKTYDNVKHTVENFKPFLDRTVKDQYRRIDESGTIIIIRGQEVGQCWTHKDYLTKGKQITIDSSEDEEESEE